MIKNHINKYVKRERLILSLSNFNKGGKNYETFNVITNNNNIDILLL